MIKLIMTLLLLYAIAAIATTDTEKKELPKKLDVGARHQTSGLNSHFPDHLQNFEQYIDHYREVISKARTDLKAANREWVMGGNTPFQLQPESHCRQKLQNKYQRGVVLAHGLTDSTYQMRHLAEYFQQQCFYVVTLLLPGHGTRPGDLLEVSWKDWVAAVDFAVDQMSNLVDNIYLGGYSTGGTLALYKASKDKRVKGVFAFSPAVKITGWSVLTGFVDWLGVILFDSMRWLNVRKDEDYFKYESLPYNAVYQIYRLTKVTTGSLAKNGIDVPVFTVASAEDSTVKVEATIELMKSLEHKKNRMLLYSQHRRSEPAPIRVVDSHFPAERLLGLAHTGLSIPIDDPYYGDNGTYRNCSHYYDEGNQDYVHCKQDENVFTGETTKENLKNGILVRPMYNYLYQEMLDQLDSFIKDL